MIKAYRFCISGRVQGVCFRAGTQAKAKELSLTGWVRNLPDGRVETMACGDTQALAAFERWLWEGPRRAEVSAVEAVPETPEPRSRFDVL